MVQKIAEENKVQFINENIHMVPKNQYKRIYRINDDGTQDFIYENEKKSKRNPKTGQFEK